MTDLRGQSDVSRDAVVPLQVDAASGPEEVISERALETGSRSLGANAWRDLRRRPMFWISLALIVLFLVMAIFPQLFTSKDPNFADLTKARQLPSGEALFGYDAQGDEYGDMIETGIIDPAKVVRVALQDAASVAGLLITTEAAIGEAPKKDNGHGHAHGHGGMGGMDM